MLKQQNNIPDIALTIFSQGPAVLYIAKAYGDYAPTFLTPNVQKQLGYTREEFLTTPDFWVSHIHPDDRESVLNELSHLYTIGHHTLEYRFLHKDGSYRWMHDELILMRNGAGAPQGIAGHWVDISESRQTGEHLKLFRKLLDSSNDAIFVIDPATGQFIDVNHAANQRLGYSRDELLDLKLQDIDKKLPDPSSLQCYIQQLQQQGNSLLHSEHRRKDGTSFPVEISSNYLEQDGRSYLVAVARDVTERQRAKQKLDSTISQLNATLEATADGILVVDREGTISNFNQTFVQLWRIPEEVIETRDDEQVLAFVLDQLVSPDSFIDKVNALYATPEAESFDVLRFKDGRIFERYSRPQRVENRVAGRVWSFRDVTEREHSRQTLIIARQQAEEASLAKSQFLGSMSHELRTPLNAILGFAQLLEMDDSMTENQQESINYILTSGRHLLGLVDNVLNLSGLAAGKLELNIQPVCITDILSSCVQLVDSGMANQGNISMNNAITDNDLMVYADKLHLGQILINLLSNAVKYNRENGRVTISSVVEQGNRLRVQVSDTGTGISSEQMAQLFRPFDRINQNHGTILGAGIGLDITRQLVEGMQGSVGVESVVGEGSTFWFELPLVTVDNA